MAIVDITREPSRVLTTHILQLLHLCIFLLAFLKKITIIVSRFGVMVDYSAE